MKVTKVYQFPVREWWQWSHMVAFPLHSAIPSCPNNCLTAAEASDDPEL